MVGEPLGEKVGRDLVKNQGGYPQRFMVRGLALTNLHLPESVLMALKPSKGGSCFPIRVLAKEIAGSDHKGLGPVAVEPAEPRGMCQYRDLEPSDAVCLYPAPDMEAHRTSFEDLVPFAEAFWELPH